MKIGVVGLGGLGHMAVKWAVAFGCEVRSACSSGGSGGGGGSCPRRGHSCADQLLLATG